MAFCLSSLAVEEFKKRLVSGEITPEKLNDMNSKERHDYFKSFLGETAAEKVNALFESKLLLKNQQQGIITWASKFSKTQPKVYKDILSQVNKMDKILDPKSEDAFYADLAKQKLGFGVTMEEASNLHALSKKATDLKEKVLANQQRPDYLKTETPDELALRMEYGASSGDFSRYYEQLKFQSTDLTLKEAMEPGNWWKAFSGTAGFAKAMKASLDISVILRQGLKVAFTHPGVWAKNSVKAFQDFGETFVGRDVMPVVMADAVSQPNYLNGKFKQIGLDVKVREEAYPTSVAELVEKIPLAKEFFKYLGRSFKASEVAFRAFQIRTRVDLANHLIEVAEKSGGELAGIGEVVNSLTGRGVLPGERNSGKDPGFLNNVFFSPRLVRSNVDALTAHVFSKDMGKGLIAAKGDFSKMSVARQEAAKNTLKIISGIAGVLMAAKMINPDSVEEDPTSSDFGKIKVGHTRFDVSGGMSGLAVLASRLITQSQKSSTTGVKTEFGKGLFDPNSADVIWNFASNKLSPMAAVIKDIATGKDFRGKSPTFASEFANLLAPIAVTNYVELQNNPNSANIIVAILADSLGIGTNTYSYAADWSESEGKEIKQFREKVGEDKFKEANKEFNTKMNEWLDTVDKNADYQKLSDEDRKKIILNKKIEFKKAMFKKHGFYPRKDKANVPKF